MLTTIFFKTACGLAHAHIESTTDLDLMIKIASQHSLLDFFEKETQDSESVADAQELEDDIVRNLSHC